MALFARNTIFRMAVAAVAAATALALLAGCTDQLAGSEEQDQGRAYLSEVNQVMDDLNTRLDSFTDAVSRDDVVAMQTQVQNALAALDELGSIEVPEGYGDIHQLYVEGSDSLRQALDEYVTLYTQISSATDSQPFDWSTYEGRLAEIQKLYDEGIEKLQAGDTAVAELEGGESGDQGSQS